MTREQKQRLLSNIFDILFPTCERLQNETEYPKHFEYELDNEHKLSINTLGISIKKLQQDINGEIIATEASKTIVEIIENKATWPDGFEERQFCIFGFESMKFHYIQDDSLIPLTEALIQYIKEVQQYQNKINSLVEFAEHIGVSAQRFVMI